MATQREDNGSAATGCTSMVACAVIKDTEGAYAKDGWRGDVHTYGSRCRVDDCKSKTLACEEQVGRASPPPEMNSCNTGSTSGVDMYTSGAAGQGEVPASSPVSAVFISATRKLGCSGQSGFRRNGKKNEGCRIGTRKMLRSRRKKTRPSTLSGCTAGVRKEFVHHIVEVEDVRQ